MVPLLKIIKEIIKALSKKKPPVKPAPKAKPSCKTGCPKPNPYKKKTKAENEKSKKSYEELRDEHKQKLEDYKSDPLKHDNDGRYANAPNEGIRQKIYNGRIKTLGDQIRKHEGELRKIQEALDGQ